MLKLLGTILSLGSGIWKMFFGEAAQARKDERKLAQAEFEAINAKNEAAATDKARETERNIEEAREKVREEKPPKRKPRAGDDLFGGGLCLIFILFLCIGCIKKPIAEPTPVVICPTLPVPTKPEIPPVRLPPPDENGNFCLSTDQIDAIAEGIDLMKLYIAEYEVIVEEYNKQYGEEKEKPPEPGG